MTNLRSSFDPAVERAYKWFLDRQSLEQWSARKQSIEAELRASWASADSSKWDIEFFRHLCPGDRFGWYLYVIENALYNSVNSEVNEAARLMPIFRRLGDDIELIESLGGIEKKIELLLSPKEQPDQILFEILVALIWTRNGYSDVEFVPESPLGKTPDIKAKNGSKQWFIEAKRLSLRSGYSQKEKEKFSRLWEPVRKTLFDSNLSVALDITFHVELQSLADDFAIGQLKEKLRFIEPSSTLVSNEFWTVKADFIDFNKIRKHLSGFYVKVPSRQLQELITGPWMRNRTFSMDMRAKTKNFGTGGIGHFLDQVSWAAGVHWHCDAEQAFESKARDIRGHLSRAVQQLPENELGAVHVGIDTFDGDLVEVERFQRIMRTATAFDPDGKLLNSIYCHLFESYAPIDAPWYFDETIYEFHAKHAARPISLLASVSPNDELSEGVHWLRDAP